MNRRKIKGYVEDIDAMIKKIDAKKAEMEKADLEFGKDYRDKQNVLSAFTDRSDMDKELSKMRKEHEKQQKKAEKSIDKMEKKAERKQKKVFKPVNRLETIIKMLNVIKENTEKEIQKVEDEIKRIEGEIANAQGKEKDKLEKQLSKANKKQSSLIKKLEVIIKQLDKYGTKHIETVRTLKSIISSATDSDKYIKYADEKEKQGQKPAEPKDPKKEPEKKPAEQKDSKKEPEQKSAEQGDSKKKPEKKPTEQKDSNKKPEEQEGQQANEEEKTRHKKEMADEISRNIQKQFSEEQLKRAEEARNNKEKEENGKLPDVKKSKLRVILSSLGINIKNVFNKIKSGARNMGASMRQAMIEILQEAQEKLENDKEEKQEKPDWYEEKTIDNGGIKLSPELQSKREEWLKRDILYKGTIQSYNRMQKDIDEIDKKLPPIDQGR